MEIIAHRGASAYALENTLTAIRLALEMGAKAMEIDLHLSSDGRLVVCHEDNLELPNGSLFYLAQKTLAEIQAVPLPGNERVPSLEEVVDTVKGRAKIYLELKALGTAKALATWLKSRKVSNVAATSFLPSEVETFEKHSPEYSVSLITAALPKNIESFFQGLATRELSLSRGFAFESEVKRAKAAGLTLRVYTVNNKEEALRFSRWGVDAVFTDKPDLLK